MGEACRLIIGPVRSTQNQSDGCLSFPSKDEGKSKARARGKGKVKGKSQGKGNAKAKARARATTREEMQNDLGKVKAAEVVDRLKTYGLAVEGLGLDIIIFTIDLLPFNWQAV